MNIEGALKSKADELNAIQTDIDSLIGQASALKDSVKKYNDLMRKAADLKKEKKHKKREYDVVIGFFKSTDENYLTKIFPLFSEVLP